MKKYTYGLIAVWFLLALSGCAGPNELLDTPDAEGDIDVFFMGIVHGIFIVPIFVVSLFTDNVSIYASHNSGNWYDFGFIMGIVALVSAAKSRD